MTSPETCWTLLRDAADGQSTASSRFVDLYAPAVRAAIGARWRGGPLAADVDDATQEVFVECFKDGGVLARAADGRAPSFRAFLFGVTRNVARRFEERASRRRDEPVTRFVLEDEAGADDGTMSGVFDRQWGRALLARATRRLAEQAADDAARRRLELLRLRFVDDLPIREIAKRWDADPARLHHDYARARREFAQALRDVITHHHPDQPGAVERELLEVFGDRG